MGPSMGASLCASYAPSVAKCKWMLHVRGWGLRGILACNYKKMSRKEAAIGKLSAKGNAVLYS